MSDDIDTLIQNIRINGFENYFSNNSTRAKTFLFFASLEFSIQCKINSVYRARAFPFILDQLGLYLQLKELYNDTLKDPSLYSRYLRYDPIANSFRFAECDELTIRVDENFHHEKISDVISNWYTDEAIEKKNKKSGYKYVYTHHDISYDVEKVLDRKIKSGKFFWYKLEFKPIRNIIMGQDWIFEGDMNCDELVEEWESEKKKFKRFQTRHYYAQRPKNKIPIVKFTETANKFDMATSLERLENTLKELIIKENEPKIKKSSISINKQPTVVNSNGASNDTSTLSILANEASSRLLSEEYILQNPKVTKKNICRKACHEEQVLNEYHSTQQLHNEDLASPKDQIHNKDLALHQDLIQHEERAFNEDLVRNEYQVRQALHLNEDQVRNEEMAIVECTLPDQLLEYMNSTFSEHYQMNVVESSNIPAISQNIDDDQPPCYNELLLNPFVTNQIQQANIVSLHSTLNLPFHNLNLQESNETIAASSGLYNHNYDLNSNLQDSYETFSESSGPYNQNYDLYSDSSNSSNASILLPITGSSNQNDIVYYNPHNFELYKNASNGGQ